MLEVFKKIEPMTEEIITTRKIMDIKADRNVSGIYGYTYDWTGEKHYGFLMTENVLDENSQKYFMEIEWIKHSETSETVLCEPVAHKLIPMSLKAPEKTGNVLVDAILKNCEDTFTFYPIYKDVKRDYNHPNGKAPIGFYEFNFYELKKFRKSDEEIRAFNKYKEDAYYKFVTLSVPAEDELWYELCDGRLSCILSDVINVMRINRHNIYVDGERDSFGWVTKGIWLDGQCMCLI